MSELKLFGSGGYVVANLSDEQAKKADLGVGKLFLAPVGKIDEKNMLKHFCNECQEEFGSSPRVRLEEQTNEEVADNLHLLERGQYICQKCSSVIGEYRVFEKGDAVKEIGKARTSND